MSMDRRADSTTISIVILFGMVAVLSIGIFVVAASSMTTFEQQAENDRIETSFVEFSNNLQTVSTGGDSAVEMTLEVDEEHGAVALRDTGNITVNSSDMGEPIEISIGTVVYEGDDGFEVAYQAGGVFRGSGEEAQLVSAPPVSYDRGDETLNFPVISVGEEGELHGDVQLSQGEIDGHSQAHVVENDTVRLTIQSEYYLGWKEYFEHEADAAAVQEVDHDEGLIEVHLEPLALPESFTTGISTLEPVDPDGNPDYDENETDETAYPELDPVIGDMVAEENTSENRLWADNPGDDPLVMDGSEQSVWENGTYYADEIDTIAEMEFDLSDGNATIVVDGDVTLNEPVEITDRKNNQTALRIYTTGDFLAYNSVNSELNVSSAFQLYGTSQTGSAVDNGPDESFTGGLITPSNDYEGDHPDYHQQCGGGGQGGDDDEEQVVLHDNVDLYGVIVAESVCMRGGDGSLTFEYEDSMYEDGIEPFPPGYTLPPSLTFLNIAEYDVDVEGT